MSVLPGSDTDDGTRAPLDPRVERTRLAVIDAGWRMLVEQGPDAINHAAIASVANVSRTTLYKYWPTRAKLLLDVFAAHDSTPPANSTGDLRADLLSFLTALRDSLVDPIRRRVFASMLSQAQWDGDVEEVHQTLRAVPLASFQTMFDEAAERGEIAEGTSLMLAAGRLIGPLFFAALITQDVGAVDVESIVDDWLAGARPVDRAD